MVRFPSVDWFEEVTALLTADTERLKRLGYLDANVGILVDFGDRTAGYVLEFAGYAPHRVHEVPDPVPESDFTISGRADAWREMIENIAEHGEPDLEHTLNRLTMAGTPLRLVSDDQLKLDLFFRFNQSFQAFFNASAGIVTDYATLAPA
jgi:hypothetical protein